MNFLIAEAKRLAIQIIPIEHYVNRWSIPYKNITIALDVVLQIIGIVGGIREDCIIVVDHVIQHG